MIFYNPKKMKGLLKTISQPFAKVVVNQYRFLIDFQGLMYFDDEQTHKNPKNLIRDRKFIEKFYRSLRINEEQHVDGYRYVGQFWGERNYLRYSTAPIIYTAINQGEVQFSMGLKSPFKPERLFLDQKQQLCYPFQSEFITLKGIFSNQLSTSILPMLNHNEGKTTLHFQGKEYEIAISK